MERERTISLKMVSVCLLICGLIAFLVSPVFGEEWNAEQKEVIKAVEARLESIKKGDLEGVMAFLHDDCLEWHPGNLFLRDKNSLKGYYKYWIDANRPVASKAERLAVQIIGNVAVVYSRYEVEGTLGRVSRGRSVIVMVKQGNEWKRMGMMNAGCDKPVRCPPK